MTLTITIPLPPRILSPNARPHHMAKARKVKEYRGRAYLAVLTEVPGGYKPRWKSALCSVTWYAKTATHPDGDNALASLKAAFDGFTDAGLFSDDRGLTHAPVKFDKDKLNPRVEITIQPLE